MDKLELKINNITILDYVEFSFALPFGDLFFEDWNENDWKKDGKQINEISEDLCIPFDFEYLDGRFENDSIDVEVFHKPNDSEEFISIEFADDPTDQCGMVILGVRCLKEKENKIRESLFDLYKKGQPRSSFSIDYFNQTLYRRTFGSDFYFYKDQKPLRKRKQYHHNIKDKPLTLPMR
ncbi:MAG: hypothetical protein QNK23_05120 [Crocinitomicaceae bacterium]|nr:hypothetical protein [Crocinitomicaceae bacterium]